MNILMISPWKNTWISYWTKFMESRGHKVKWHIGRNCDLKLINKELKWCDCILNHWADKWATVLSNSKINKKLFVILRSYEIFGAEGWANLPSINWSKVTKLFMLNESFVHPLNCRIPGLKPIFFKNGIDVDEWQLQKKSNNSKNNIAWICDINEKKGVELCVQAIDQLCKVNKNITLEHIGRNQDLRRWFYLENIMPHLKTKWFNTGYENEHNFVKNFLEDKAFVISSSIVEGHPMNLIEAMATGCVPLIHRYPGVEYQFPEKYIWNNFDDLVKIYKTKHNPKEVRDFVVSKYDYRVSYKPVVEAIEGAK